MITVQLLGGMGNQMFQYAFALALRARGYEVQLDKSRIKDGNPHPCIREYSLGTFGAGPFASPGNEVTHEQSLRFDPANLTPKDPSTLLGYWQSEKYFKDIEDTVRKALVFRTPLSDYARNIKTSLENTNSVFMHVRRTDFLKYPDHHGTMTPDYYRAALDYLGQRTLHMNVVMFSDDPDWCEQNFGYQMVRGTTKYEDMELMSACKHGITANSTFSWWGAWLGDNKPNRIVIAPKQWLTSKTCDTSTMVPERWVRL